MATMEKTRATEGGTVTGEQITGIGSPISNEAYDVLTALHSKLEGLEAYRKFAKDGNSALWREMSETDCKSVERLVGELESLVKNGKFRMKEPGNANA